MTAHGPVGDAAARPGGREEFRRHWRTFLGCFLAASIGTIGFYGYTGGVLMPVLVQDAGFARRDLSMAAFLLSAAVAVLAPIAGAAMDRFGALRIVAIGVAGEAAAFMLFALIPSRIEAYFLAIGLLALLGVATTPPAFSRLITERFDRARGLALGGAISGLGVMAICAPIGLRLLLDHASWRSAYAAMGATVLVLGGLGVLLILSDPRDTPGERPAARAARPARGGDWSAVRRPLFWTILVAFALASLCSGGVLLHLVSLLEERGYASASAAQVQALVGVAVLAGRLGSGAAMDRVFAPWVAAGIFGVSAAGCLLLAGGPPGLAGLAGLGIGLTVGAELDIMAFLVSRYFGVANFGRLYGLAYGLLIIGGGFSPVLISILSQAGGYPTALATCAGGLALAAGILVFAPRFEPASDARLT